MPLFPGDRLGPYEILALIGAGGMGEVYKARDARLERLVALKQMKGQHDGRFRQEARAIAALNHPNICQIYDIGPNYLIMEYVEGKPISGPMPEEEALKLASQIVRALQEAHRHGILHRDLKPGNILVAVNGTTKLIDFGLAKLFATLHTDETASSDGAILGTMAYMSPEQAQGQPVDERSDIFSFGVVLYEMLSGKRPFEGGSAAAIVSALLRDQPAPLAVSADLHRILDKCLAKVPADRFVTMAELSTEIERQSNHSSQVPFQQSSLASLAAQFPAPVTVGREAQLAQIWRGYNRAKDGRGLFLAVTGEAGIGKTSILEAFLRQLSQRGERPVVARGRCSQRLAGEEPYLPILEALDSLLHHAPNSVFATLIKTVSPTWYGMVAQDASPPDGKQRQAEPSASQERMKREFAALFKELSRSQTFVLLLEDLHWADVSTIDMMNYLAGHFAGMHVLILASYRPSDMALRGHPFRAIRNDLQSRGLLEEMELQFLALPDVERYLSLEFPDHDLPPSFALLIHDKTEGSPLFMADLVRYLRDTGGIVEEDGHWTLSRSLPDAPRHLPASMRGMIERKIEQVEERDLKLLLAASVQGPEFDSAVLAEAAEMDPADVEDRLDTLERVHVFVHRGEESEFPDHSLTLSYRFVHVLYQNALYESLQPTRRAALSGRVARALVKRYGDQGTSVAARVAVLFETARDFAASAQHYAIAARRSVGIFAFREALALAERGLNDLRPVPDGPAHKQQELGLLMVKAAALRATSGWSTPELEAVFTKARQLCQDLADPPELIPVLWATTLFLMIRGSLLECRARADELMVLAGRSREQTYIMAAHHIAGVVREFIGDMVEASRLLEHCRLLHDPSRHLFYQSLFGQDPGVAARGMSSRSLWALGYPDQALERARETVAITQAHRQPTGIAFSLLVLQGIHMVRGEAAAALAIGEEIRSICAEYELPQEAGWSSCFHGYAMHLQGRTSEGIDELKRSLAALEAISAGLVRSAFLALLAEALCHAGRIEEGQRAVDDGFAHAQLSSEGGYLAELHRVRGELLVHSSRLEEAEQSFRAALQYAARQQTRSFELRAAIGLARLLLSRSRPEEARAALDPLYQSFNEGKDTADLISARTLLSEIG